jgi:hypothetical protein
MAPDTLTKPVARKAPIDTQNVTTRQRTAVTISGDGSRKKCSAISGAPASSSTEKIAIPIIASQMQATTRRRRTSPSTELSACTCAAAPPRLPRPVTVSWTAR